MEKTDDVRMGQCCQSIGNISPMMFGNTNSQVQYQCFSVEDYITKQAWSICHTDGGIVDEVRQYIVLSVIKYGLSTFGIYGLEELMRFQKQACNKPTGWSYSFQSRWPCMCPEGMMQSPIDINSTSAINNTKIYTDFRKWKQKVKSYVQIVSAQESYASGDFGSVVFRDQRRRKISYKAIEVRFKFPSEHTINGKQLEGEMQVVHSNSDTKLITSIFLTADENNISLMKLVSEEKQSKFGADAVATDMDVNNFFASVSMVNSKSTSDFFNIQTSFSTTFLQSFNSIDWKDFDATKGTVQANGGADPREFCIPTKSLKTTTDASGAQSGTPDTTPDADYYFNLYRMFDQKDSLTTSFFTYMGSDTKPPCNEDVQWVILKDPYLIATAELDELKKKVIGTDQNTRNQMPLEGREVLSFD